MHNPTFPVLVGCGGLYSQYGDGYIPYNVVIDTEGIVRYANSGFSESAIHNVINQFMSVDFPVFSIQELAIVSDGNMDGRPDAGESVDFTVSMRNTPIGVGATDVQVTLNCDAESISITNGAVSFPDAAPGDVVEGDAAFSFDVAEGIEPHWATFVLTYTASYDGGTVEESIEHVQRIGRPDLLVFDSDGGVDDNEAFATSALSTMGVAYDVASSAELAPIADVEFARYEQILWLGGSNENDLTADERTGLDAFLTQGGFLIFSSQFASDDPDNAAFISERFGVTTVEADGGSIFLAHGTEGDEWFGGGSFVATGVQGANNNVEPDVIEVGDGASALASWAQGSMGVAAAYTIRPAYHAIYLGFPVEATRVHNSVPTSMNLSMFLERAFAFHDAAVAVGDVAPAAPQAWRLLDAAPNPFNPTTTLRYELSTAAEVELHVFNALGQQVALLQPGRQTAGVHESVFDGSRLASGLYLVELSADGVGRDALKLMLVK